MKRSKVGQVILFERKMSKNILPYLSFEGMHTPEVVEALETAASRVIKSNWYILGKEVERFEAQFADYVGCQYGVGTNSGLDALIIALQCLEIGPGDEVLVASNAYVACWNAIHSVGATIVPVEPSEISFNISAEGIKSAITPRTKAIMAVHLYGQMCYMPKIMELADRHGIYVIEDNAQAQGAVLDGKKSASWGHINATSFYPGKNLGALGDAGMITTDNQAWARKAKALRNYGCHKKYHNQYIGMNSRLDEMQAALLSVKLDYLDQWNLERRKIAAIYTHALERYLGDDSERDPNDPLQTLYADIILPDIPTDGSHVCHIYCIVSMKRDALQAQLAEAGIGTLIHYPIPPHLQESYKYLGCQKGDYPVAERLAKQSLSLPIWVGITERQLRLFRF